MSCGRRMRSAARRLRLHARVSHRPDVGGQSRTAYLCRSKRGHEGANRVVVVSELEGCLHELIEAQARRTPEEVAVVYEDQRLTYRELNARADALAHSLRGLGVGPDIRVGLYVERSLE